MRGVSRLLGYLSLVWETLEASAMTVAARLFLERTLDAPELRGFCGGHVALFTAAAPGGGRTNEDGLVCAELAGGSGVLAVADGAGGAPAGDRACAIALRRLLACLEGVNGKSLREAILMGFDDANRAVAGLGVGAATTLAVVRIEGGTVRSYHAGDSLVLVVGQRGRRRHETIAHSPVGYAVHAGVLDEVEAIFHEQRHLVSNLVGLPDMRVEMSASIPLHARDTVLLASDGLSDNLHVDEIVELIRKGPLDEAAVGLAAAGAARMQGSKGGVPSKPDDLTFALFRQG
jgi:serine/threonine protein phosphatase PrpC